ncbi:MAG: DUF167 domain-containing protein [Nitrosomonadales bacterium]|nr:DUF167 domain-containing protein [Nitrosomonadales bacterium]
MSSFCHWEGDTLVLNILGRPRAKKTKIGKVIGKQLEIYVAENPVRGKATAHLVQFLAEEFQVPKSAITVVFGVYNVNKQLRITAPKRLPSVIPPPTHPVKQTPMLFT